MRSKNNSNINNNESDYGNYERNNSKLLIVFGLLGIGFLLLIGRLFYIQIIKSDEYKVKAKLQHESTVKLKAERGNIYDRKGRLLATTVKSTSYGIDPSIIKDTIAIKKIVRIICGITSKDTTELYNKIINSKKSFLWLVRGISGSMASALDSIKLRGLIKLEEPKRLFLYGSVASQIIGCTDIDNNGLAGIELSCDSLLKGAAGMLMMVRDAKGRLNPTASKPIVKPVSGKSVLLTIDIELQRIAENELLDGINASGAEAGSVIIQDPVTGEILAMASYPTFDPNNIDDMQSGAMRNRAITDAYEPGSTFKTITASAAVEENLISKNDIVDGHNGLVKFYDYEIKDDHPIGKVKFHEAIEQSSNIVFSELAYRIPTNFFFKYIRDFGFGLPYGIEIPGETSGRIKNVSQMDAVTKRFTGFGYGMLVTSLQMVNAYSTIANSGKMMKPFIVSKIINPDNSNYFVNKPLKIREVISKSSSKEISELLNGVVNYGTGKQARIYGLKISGKTGTAQQISDSAYSKQHYTASFAGYLPSDNPRITMIVVLDKPKTNIYGGSTAAPIFRNIAKSWISVSKDFLSDVNVRDKVIPINPNAVTIPDLKGLDATTAMRVLNQFGLRTKKIEKNYTVASLTPLPGTVVSKGSEVFLNRMQINFKAINVVGLELKQAISILGHNGIECTVNGFGKVIQQEWEQKKDGILRCRLICR